MSTADNDNANPTVSDGQPPGQGRDDTTSIDPRSDPKPTDEDGKPIEDGMSADADPDAAGEDEPVPSIDGDEE